MKKRVNMAHSDFEYEQRDKTFNLTDLPLRELVILYLKDIGYVITQGRSMKYLTFTNPNNTDDKYFVGLRGSVSKGRTVSDSISMSYIYTREKLIKALKARGY